MTTQSPLSGWHSRAKNHPSKSSFTPTADTLSSGIIHSTPVNPTGLGFALFTPDFVIDAQGRVLQVPNEDWTGLETLTKAATSDNVPKTESFRNQWRIEHPRTSMAIDWLRVSYGVGQGVREVSVYGFTRGASKLEEPGVGGMTELPAVLQEAFHILGEGREKEGDGEGDSSLLEAVSKIVAGEA